MPEAKYFYFDRELWEEGVFANCRCDGDALAASAPEAAYTSPLLDSGETETVWARLRLRAARPDGSRLRFSCAAADNQDALRAFPPVPAVESDRPEDLPLFAAKGRYLRFRLIFRLDGGEARVSGLRLDFPLRSIADFLPAFYRDNADGSFFLERFLALYQSPMDDLAEAVAAFPARLDAQAAAGDELRLLAAWAGVEEPDLWPEDKLRRLVGQSFRLCARKGTRSGLVELLTLYLGAPPLLVEPAALAEASGEKLYSLLYAPLFGRSAYSFYVLTDAESLADQQEADRLQRIIDLYKPARTQAHLIPLERYTVLGGHSYLGLNSALSSVAPLALRGNATLPFHTALLE